VDEAAAIDSRELVWPTVAQILTMPEMRRGRPTIEAGARAIDNPVRWAHASELADIGDDLQGGELVLTTGVTLPSSDGGLSRYIGELASAKAAGLAIELGRRFTTLPPALVTSANERDLPLIAFHTEVPFVDITEAVNTMIVNNQVKQLQRGELAHRAFHSLAIKASTPQEIVHQVATLAECAVVYENTDRRVLIFDGVPINATEFLDNWEQRSREAAVTDQNILVDGENWLATSVAARGQIWGRLIILPPDPASALQRTILELGATTLLGRDAHLLEHQTHQILISDIVNHNYLSPDEIHVRAKSLGVVTQRMTLVAMIVDFAREMPLSDIARRARVREEVTAVSKALVDAGASGLVGLLELGKLSVVVTAPSENQMNHVLDVVARAIHERASKLTPPGSSVIGVGSVTTSIDGLGASFAEANEAADAASSVLGPHLYVTTADIRMRGLIYLLRDDARLQRFAERELAPLISHDARHHSDLLATLAAYLDAGGNKSAAAEATFMNRASFYHRLARIEEILNCDLESPESRFSLYMALAVRNALIEAASKS
jgi:purine catabolism regulator